jgi:phosphoglycolate phosphatase-like HAD superfamily hydrolase
VTRGVILDLDGTVIDTTGIQALREARNWRACVRQADKTTVFPGMQDMLSTLVAAGVRLGLCTSAVSFYASALLDHHEIDAFDAMICFHDAKPSKPHPAPIVASLAKLQILGADAIGVGDSLVDAMAYRAAGVYSIGAGWNPALDRNAGWDLIAKTPSEISCLALRTGS